MTNYHKFDADHVLDACRQCGEWATHRSHATATAYEKAEKLSHAYEIHDICGTCAGFNIRQQITFMVDPNARVATVDIADAEFSDYYWCNDCEDECAVEETRVYKKGSN